MLINELYSYYDNPAPPIIKVLIPTQRIVDNPLCDKVRFPVVEVPEKYIDNELKDYLNKNFEVNPPIPLKPDSRFPDMPE